MSLRVASPQLDRSAKRSADYCSEMFSAKTLGAVWTQPRITEITPKYFTPAKLGVIAHAKAISKPHAILSQSSKKTLPNALSELEQEINHSIEILDLQEGWDGKDAPPIPKEIYNSSINFLKDHAKYIYKNMGIAIPSPEINPGRNENIFLSWRTEKVRLAINIQKQNNDDIVAIYYGDCYNNIETTKSSSLTSKVSEPLAYWMKNLV